MEETLLERIRKITNVSKTKEKLDIDQIANTCFDEFVKKIERRAEKGDTFICAERVDIVSSKICKRFKLYHTKNYSSLANEIYKKVLEMFENENFKVINKRVCYSYNSIPKYLTYIEW